MAITMGVREFRDGLTTIVREAAEPVIVTNHDKVVGWFTPANRPQRPVGEILEELKSLRRSVEARGVDVAARLRDLGLEDETLFDTPPLAASRVRSATPRRKSSEAKPQTRKHVGNRAR